MFVRHVCAACTDGLQSVAMVLLYSDSFQLPGDYPDNNRDVLMAMGKVAECGNLERCEYRWIRGRQSEEAVGEVSQILVFPEHQADQG